MKNIIIVEKKILDSEYVMYPSSYMNPMKNISSLELNLCDRIKKPCTILVDLLLCNGNSFNRFLELYFDGTHIDRNTIEIVSLNIDDKKSVNEFYKLNKKMLFNSVLEPSEYMTYIR